MHEFLKKKKKADSGEPNVDLSLKIEGTDEADEFLKATKETLSKPIREDKREKSSCGCW